MFDFGRLLCIHSSIVPISDTILIDLLFQEWGKPGDIHNLGIDWHIPSDEELSAAQKLIDEFLSDELTKLSEFARGKIILDRDQLLNRLNVVSNILFGCGTFLPFWNGDKNNTDTEEFGAKKLVDSVTDLTPLEFVTVPKTKFLTLQGKNVRQEVAKVAFELQVKFAFNSSSMDM